jgi:hypothetical protein
MRETQCGIEPETFEIGMRPRESIDRVIDRFSKRSTDETTLLAGFAEAFEVVPRPFGVNWRTAEKESRRFFCTCRRDSGRRIVSGHPPKPWRPPL